MKIEIKIRHSIDRRIFYIYVGVVQILMKTNQVSFGDFYLYLPQIRAKEVYSKSLRKILPFYYNYAKLHNDSQKFINEMNRRED